MLKKTFSHVEGVSNTTEKLLWENEIDSWETFLEKYEEINFLPKSKIEVIKTEIHFSIEHLRNNNIRYFKEKIVEKEHWRLKDHAKICYLDIETTGLSRWTDEITLIGIYDGYKQHLFVKGENLEDASEFLKQFDIVVTFNGKMFDVPFMEYKFNEKYDLVHLDLRFLLREFGLKGGLKSIEKSLGIRRDEDVTDIDGREAVRLWRRYKTGDLNALELLKKYNKEDIVNLKTLLDYYVNRKTSL